MPYRIVNTLRVLTFGSSSAALALWQGNGAAPASTPHDHLLSLHVQVHAGHCPRGSTRTRKGMI